MLWRHAQINSRHFKFEGVAQVGLVCYVGYMSAPKDPNLTAAEIIASVYYDPETGIFTRRTGKPIAAKLTAKGYLRFEVAETTVRAHRLAWFYCYGRWPLGMLDHINRDPSDNRICNLREANASTNNMNKNPAVLSKHGFRGVEKHNQKYRAGLGFKGRSLKGPSRLTPAEAHADYLRMAQQLYGDFVPL
jgi:hypothetical protein